MSKFDSIALNILTFPTGIKIWRKERKDRKLRNRSIMTSADINKIVKEAEDAGYDDIKLSKVKADVVLNYNKNIRRKEEEKAKVYKKVIKSVLDTAEDKAGYCCNGNQIDSDLYKKINKLEAYRDQYRYTKAAVHSQRLINYTIWRSTDPTAIGLDSIVDKDKQFINGICKELHIDPIYKKVGALDMKLFDPWIAGWNDQEYLINLSAIHELCTVNLQERINSAITNGNNSTISNNGGYVPIHFMPAPGTSANILVDPTLVVDSYNESLLEAALEDYYEDGIPEHHFEKEGSNFKAVIKNPSNLINEEFRFNIGFFGKDIVSLIKDNNLGQVVYVHRSCKDIWEKVLKNCFYQLNEQDTNNAYKVLSPYFNVYNMVDMSTVPESDIIGTLDIILNTMSYWYGQMGVNFSTYRFERYNGPKDFILNGADGSVIIYNGSECCYRLGSLYKSLQM